MQLWRRTAIAFTLGIVALFSGAVFGAGDDGTADFTLPTLEGRMLSLSDYRGKWVVVNYWATWCPPCIEEIPDLIDFYEARKGRDAVVIGVNMEEISLTKLREFVDEYMISYPVVHMMPAYKTELGKVPGLPTSYIIAPNGNVVAGQSGPLTADDLNQFIDNFEQEKVVAK